jgi:hypothetical protein
MRAEKTNGQGLGLGVVSGTELELSLLIEPEHLFAFFGL